MEFKRHTKITLTAKISHGSRLEITNDSDQNPDSWYIAYIDYDDACGAYGEFASEEETMQYLDRFLILAEKLYAAKYAKYGPTPKVFLKDGILTIDLNDGHL